MSSSINILNLFKISYLSYTKSFYQPYFIRNRNVTNISYHSSFSIIGNLPFSLSFHDCFIVFKLNNLIFFIFFFYSICFFVVYAFFAKLIFSFFSKRCYKFFIFWYNQEKGASLSPFIYFMQFFDQTINLTSYTMAY